LLYAVALGFASPRLSCHLQPKRNSTPPHALSNCSGWQTTTLPWSQSIAETVGHRSGPGECPSTDAIRARLHAIFRRKRQICCAFGAFRVWLNAINDNGVTIGFYEDASKYVGFMVRQSTLAYIVDPKASPAFGQDTRPTGINKWNSMVGQYVPASGMWTGFKRFSNGSFIDLAYPGSNGTYPNGINDSGLVVGQFYDTNYISHGFIYHNGNWASVDFPLGSGTSLIGVANSGTMLGASFGWGSFLYVNGAFETLPSVPNSTATTFDGLSPDGFFTGTTMDSAGQQHGFIATCK
jgi:hypothetical protein